MTVEAGLLPAPAAVIEEPRRCRMSQIIMAVGRVFRPSTGRRTRPAISGETDRKGRIKH